MALACPDCGRSALMIRSRIELPADSRSDEIAVQIIECEACGFKGVGVYEESRRGAEDSWEHFGYRLPAGELDALAEQIARCPNPTDARCGCPSHEALGRRGEFGRWVGVVGLTEASPIGMVDAPPAAAPPLAPAAASAGYALKRFAAALAIAGCLFIGGLAGGLIGAATGEEEGVFIGIIVGIVGGLIAARVIVAETRRLAGRRHVLPAKPSKPCPPAVGPS